MPRLEELCPVDSKMSQTSETHEVSPACCSSNVWIKTQFFQSCIKCHTLYRVRSPEEPQSFSEGLILVRSTASTNKYESIQAGALLSLTLL